MRIFLKYALLIVIFSCYTFVSGIVYAQDDSLSGKLAEIEVKVYLRTFDNEPLIKRLNRLENDVMGSLQTGPMIQRVNQLGKQVLAAPGPVKSSSGAQGEPQSNLNYEKLPEYNYYNPPASSEFPQTQPPISSYSNNQTKPADNNLKPVTLPPVNNSSRPNTQPSDYTTPGLNARFNDSVTEGQSLPSKEDIRKFKESKKGERQTDLKEEAANEEETNKKGKKKKKKNEEKPPEFDPQASSYYDTLMYVNKNHVIRFKKMPVSVFLPEGSNLTYRKHFRPAAIRALNLWKLMSNGQIDYVLTDNQKKAKISIVWVDNNPITEGDQEQGPANVGVNVNRAATGSLMSNAAVFVPGYYGYAASLLGYVLGGAGNTAKIRDVRLQIGTLAAMKLNEESSANLIQTVASREFGRSIGLSCYSVSSEDIMYYQLPLGGEFEKFPTSRDVNTAIQLYEATPEYTD